MGTVKVVIRRTAKKKDGSSAGTVRNSKKVSISVPKVSISKSRSIVKKAPNVNYVKDS